MFYEAVDHVLSFIASSPYDVGYSSKEIGDFIDQDVSSFFGFSSNEILRSSILRLVVDRHYNEMIIRSVHCAASSNSLLSACSSSNTDGEQVDKEGKKKRMSNKKSGRSAFNVLPENSTPNRLQSGSQSTDQRSFPKKDLNDNNMASSLSKAEVLALLNSSQVLTRKISHCASGSDKIFSSAENGSQVLQFFPQRSLTEKLFGVDLRLARAWEAARFVCLHAVEGIDPTARREFEGNDRRRSLVSSGITIFLKHEILKPVFLLDSSEFHLVKRYFPFFAFPSSSETDHQELMASGVDGSNQNTSYHEEKDKEGEISRLSPLEHYFKRCRAEKRGSQSFPDVVLNLGLIRSVVMAAPDRQLLLQDAVEAIFKSHGGAAASLRWHQLSRHLKFLCTQLLGAAGLVVVRAQLVMRGLVRPLKLVMLPEDGSAIEHRNQNATPFLSSKVNSSIIQRMKKEQNENTTNLQTDESSGDSDDDLGDRYEEENDNENGYERDEEDDASLRKSSGEVSTCSSPLSSSFQDQLIRAAMAPICYTPSFPMMLQLVHQTEHRPVTIVGALPSVRFNERRQRNRSIGFSLQRYYEHNADHISRTSAILPNSGKQLSIIYYPKALEQQFWRLELSQDGSTSMSVTRELSGGSFSCPPSSAAMNTDTTSSDRQENEPVGLTAQSLPSPSSLNSVLPPGVSAYAVTAIMDALHQASHHAVTLIQLYKRITAKSLNQRVIPYLLKTNQIVTSGYSGAVCARRVGIVALPSVVLTEELKATVVKEWLEEVARRNASIQLPSIGKLPTIANVDEVSHARQKLDQEASRSATLLVNRLMMARNGYARHSVHRAGRLHLELWWQWYNCYGKHPCRTSCSKNTVVGLQIEKRIESSEGHGEGKPIVRKRMRAQIEGPEEMEKREALQEKEERNRAGGHQKLSHDKYAFPSFPSQTFIPLQEVLSNMSLSSFCILVGIPRIDLGVFPTLHQCQHGGPVYDNLAPGISRVLQWDTRLADLPSSVQAWCRIQGYFTFLSAVKDLLERKLIKVRRVSSTGASSFSSFLSLEEDMNFQSHQALSLSLSPSANHTSSDVHFPSSDNDHPHPTPKPFSDTSLKRPSFVDVSASDLFSAPISSLEVCLAPEGRISGTCYRFFCDEGTHGGRCFLPGSTMQAVLWYWSHVWSQLVVHRSLLLSSSQEHIPWKTLVSNITLARTVALAKYFRYDIGVLGELLFQRCGYRIPQPRVFISRGLRDIYMIGIKRRAHHKKRSCSLSVREVRKGDRRRDPRIASHVFRIELCGTNLANAVFSALRTPTPFPHLERVVKTVLRMRINHVRARSQMSVYSPPLTVSIAKGNNHYRVSGIELHNSVPILSGTSSSPFASQVVPSFMYYNRHQAQGVLHLSYLSKVLEEGLQATWNSSSVYSTEQHSRELGLHEGISDASFFTLQDSFSKETVSQSLDTPKKAENEKSFSSVCSSPSLSSSMRIAAAKERLSQLCFKVMQTLSPSAETHCSENSFRSGQQSLSEADNKKTMQSQSSMSSLRQELPLSPSLNSTSQDLYKGSEKVEPSTGLSPLPHSLSDEQPIAESPNTSAVTNDSGQPREVHQQLSPALFEVLVDSMRCILLSDKSHYNSHIAHDLILSFPPLEVSRARRYLLSFNSFTKGSSSGRLPHLTFSVVRSLLPVGITRQFARPCTNAELLTSWVLSLDGTSSVLGGVAPHPMVSLLTTRRSSSFSSSAFRLSSSITQTDKSMRRGEVGFSTDGDGLLFSSPDCEGITPSSIALCEPIHLEASHLLQSEEKLSSLPFPTFQFPVPAFVLDGKNRLDRKPELKNFLKSNPNGAGQHYHQDDEDDDDEEEDRVGEHLKQHMLNMLYPARRLQTVAESHHQRMIPISSAVPSSMAESSGEKKLSSGMLFGTVPRYRRTKQATDVIPVDPPPTIAEMASVTSAIASIKENKLPCRKTMDGKELESCSTSSSSTSVLSCGYPPPYPSIFHHVDGSFHSYMWQVFVSTLFRYIKHVPGIEYEHLMSTITSNGIIGERSLHAGLAFLLDCGDIVLREKYYPYYSNNSYTSTSCEELLENPGNCNRSPFSRCKRRRCEKTTCQKPSSLPRMQESGVLETTNSIEITRETTYYPQTWKGCTFFACISQGNTFLFD